MELYGEHLARHKERGEKTLLTNQVVPRDDVRTARLLLRMRNGSIWLKGGSTDLVHAKLGHLDKSPAPELLSVTSGVDRRVEVLSRGHDDHWDFSLSDRIPIGFLVEAEGGYRDLNFNHVPLTDFHLNATDGISLVSIGGSQDFLSNAVIDQARGSIGIDLPGDYDRLSNIKLDTASGDISGIFRGYFRRLQKINIEANDGDVELDLTGSWSRICEIRVTCTDGNCTLFVPKGLGVSLKVRSACGKVYAPCTQRKWSSGAYINEAFEKTKEFLDIEVTTTDGYVQLVQMSDGEPYEMCCGGWGDGCECS